MPRDDQRPIRYTVHAEMRLADRCITMDEAARTIRTGAWEPNGLARWRARASVGGRTLEVVFVERTELQGDGEARRVLEVLLVITVFGGGRFRR